MFDVNYEEGSGWRLVCAGQPYSEWTWPSAWDCVDELRDLGWPHHAQNLGRHLRELRITP